MQSAASTISLEKPKPIVIAHRGSSGQRPEESLQAFELAVDQGSDYVEGDLVCTKDGFLIMSHSNELSDTTNVAKHIEFASRRTTKDIGIEGPVTGWFVEDFTLEEVQTLKLKERLPFRSSKFNSLYQPATLEEYLQLIQAKEFEVGRTIGVYLETKEPTYFRYIGLPLEERLVKILESFGYNKPTSPIFIESFEASNLRDLKKMTPVGLIQLIGLPETIQFDTKKLFSELVTPQGLADVATYAQGIGPLKTLIVPPHPGEATNLVQESHKAGLLVHPWTFRNEAQFYDTSKFKSAEEELETFLKLGVDGIFSDFPITAVKARDVFWQSKVQQPSI